MVLDVGRPAARQVTEEGEMASRGAKYYFRDEMCKMCLPNGNLEFLRGEISERGLGPPPPHKLRTWMLVCEKSGGV